MTSAIEFRNVMLAGGNRSGGLAVRVLDLMEAHRQTLMHVKPCASSSKDGHFIMFKMMFSEIQLPI